MSSVGSSSTLQPPKPNRPPPIKVSQADFASVRGAGLGLRRRLMRPLLEHLEAGADEFPVNFFEVAPENWIDVGGKVGERLRAFTERFPFVCHGLSLNLGGAAPLDMELVAAVKGFLRDHGVLCYTEHLSACADDGHLYDLMPVPFTEEAALHVAERVLRVQDALGQRIGVENVSYYAAPAQELRELDFINAVIDRADCLLLLDVNNIYVNSVNFGYDPSAFLRGLPGRRAAYLHVAGHRRPSSELCVDTHGAPIIDPVWRLLAEAYELFGPLPTLVERDFNLPPLPELLAEPARVRDLQSNAGPVDAEKPTALWATPPRPAASPSSAAKRTPRFQTAQRAFAAYIRHPERHPLPPGVPERRMRVYARLFYNNVESFLAETFTVLREIIPAAAWRALARDFLHHHRATSPYFSDIPQEFLEYLGSTPGPARPRLPPFALELCHYQWVGLALRFAADADCVFDDNPVAVDDALTVSPLAWPLRYDYPVDRIGAAHQPAAPPGEPTFLVARRDREGAVGFVAVNAITMRLLQVLAEGRTPRVCFNTLATETGMAVGDVARAGLRALNRLHEQDIVLRRTPA